MSENHSGNGANQPQGKKKAEVETVTMEDGRKVDFAGKRRMLKEIITEGGKPAVRFDFRDGKTRTLHVPHQHIAYAAGHGYAQKLGDQVAGLKAEDGSEADEEDMLLEIEDLHKRLEKGSDWNTVRTGGAGTGGSAVIQALVQATGKTLDQIKEYLQNKIDANPGLTRAKMYQDFRAHPQVGPVIKQLESEKAKKTKEPSVDVNALLGEIAELPQTGANNLAA